MNDAPRDDGETEMTEHTPDRRQQADYEDTENDRKKTVVPTTYSFNIYQRYFNH